MNKCQSYWAADENDYVDVWFYELITILLALKLIKTAATANSIEVFYRLIRYKK